MSDDLFDAPDLFAPAPAPATPPAQARPPRQRYGAPPVAADPAPTRDARMKPNPGKRPPSVKGRRVIVELENGKTCGEEPVTKESKPGWEADTTNWEIQPGWGWNVAYWRRA